MLILTRRIGETIRIGDDVSLTLVGISGEQVKIGTAAPPAIKVNRSEVYNRIRLAQAKAQDSSTSGDDVATDTRFSGSVAYINHAKGYGFIQVIGRERSLYFHASECGSRVFFRCAHGTVVQFNIGHNENGLAATNIILL